MLWEAFIKKFLNILKVVSQRSVGRKILGVAGVDLGWWSFVILVSFWSFPSTFLSQPSAFFAFVIQTKSYDNGCRLYCQPYPLLTNQSINIAIKHLVLLICTLTFLSYLALILLIKSDVLKSSVDFVLSKVVMLDEPTSGMDPGARHDTWSLIQSEKVFMNINVPNFDQHPAPPFLVICRILSLLKTSTDYLGNITLRKHRIYYSRCIC